MTPEEQQQVNAGMVSLEQTIANISRELANKAMQLEGCAMQLKAANEKIATLEAKKVKK